MNGYEQKDVRLLNEKHLIIAPFDNSFFLTIFHTNDSLSGENENSKDHTDKYTAIPFKTIEVKPGMCVLSLPGHWNECVFIPNITGFKIFNVL